MRNAARAVFVSVAGAVCSGTFVGTTVILVGEPAGSIGPRFPGVLIEALVVGFLTSVFVSVPLGVAGGVMVAFILRTPRPHLTRWSWVGRGALSGIAIGGLGSATYSAILNGLSEDALVAATVFLCVGAVAGLLCGAGLGLWCSTVGSNSRAPSAP